MDRAPDLVWLPEVISPGVHLILSTLEGRSLDAVRRRGWTEYEIRGLQPDERRIVATEFLWQFRKRLKLERMERIVSAPQTENPLYLRALLDELRVSARHETLDQRIDHYLSASNPGELYQRILERLDNDFGDDRRQPASGIGTVP